MGNIIEKQNVTIEDDKFILYNYINQVGHKLVVNKSEAMLLYTELHKFIMGKTPDYPLPKDHICFEKGHAFFEVNRWRNHQSEFIDRKCSRCGFEESSQYDNIF